MTATQSRTWVIYAGHTFEGRGPSEVVYSFLSKRGQGLDPTSAASGERGWLPILTDQVQRFDRWTDAADTAATYGGTVAPTEVFERMAEQFVYRLTDDGRGIEL